MFYLISIHFINDLRLQPLAPVQTDCDFAAKSRPPAVCGFNSGEVRWLLGNDDLARRQGARSVVMAGHRGQRRHGGVEARHGWDTGKVHVGPLVCVSGLGQTV